MPPKKPASRGRGRPRKVVKNGESGQSSKNSEKSGKNSENPAKNGGNPPKNAQNSLPGIKYVASRHDFSSDESEDSINPPQRSSQPQSMLGSHNTLKQLLSAGNGPIPEPSDSMKTPTKRKMPPRARQVVVSSDSPINSASTPISRLKRATAQLNSPDNWAPSPVFFNDDKEGLPPSKRSRSGFKAAKTGKNSGSAAEKTSKTAKSSATARKKKQKDPQITSRDQYSDQDQFKAQDQYSDHERPQSPASPNEYSETVTHHLINLTADESDFIPNKRRSSYNNRGKRQSSVGNGYSSKPHAQVSAQEYYKSLDPSIPEPNQMRQLLTWCFKKSLESTEDPDMSVNKDAETAKGIAKIIKHELLTDLANGTISTSWYSLKDSPTELAGKRVVKPNPLNESNKESIEVFKRKLRSLELEKLQWREALESNLRKIQGLTRIDREKKEERGQNLEDLRASKGTALEGSGLDSTALKVTALKGTDLESTTSGMEFLREYLQTRDGGKEICVQVLEPKTTILEKMEHSAKEAEKMLQNNLPSNMDQLFYIVYQLKQSLGLVDRVQQELLDAQVSELVKTFMNRNEQSDRWSHVSTKNLMKGIARLDSSKRRV